MMPVAAVLETHRRHVSSNSWKDLPLGSSSPGSEMYSSEGGKVGGAEDGNS